MKIITRSTFVLMISLLSLNAFAASAEAYARMEVVKAVELNTQDKSLSDSVTEGKIYFEKSESIKNTERTIEVVL